ncbi:MAG: 6-phosphogluconolactonase [Chloroflexota bacterium]
MTDVVTAARAAPSGEPEVIVRGAGDLAELAGERISARLVHTVATRGRADLATTGGSTVVGIYRALSDPAIRDVMPWAAVHVWFGDDRYVPRDHPLSNQMPLDDVLLQGGAVPLPLANLHPFPTGEAIGEARGPDWCAESYADELRASGVRVRDGWPVFDLVLLGVGADGHILSVFPGSPALDADDWALAVPAPSHIEPHVARVTLNPAIVPVADHVLAVIAGAAKADTVATLLGPDRDVRRWPAQLARRDGATWIVDSAAAARLPR